MMEARRRAYLDAIGIDVWTKRPVSPARDRLVLQPGNGGTLLLCPQAEDTALRIAGDITRALSQDTVWAWPDPDCGDDHVTLEQAITRDLFTRVVVFGSAVARGIFKKEAPEVVGSARILIVPELGELAIRGEAKQALWRKLAETGLTNPSA